MRDIAFEAENDRDDFSVTNAWNARTAWCE